MIARIEADKQRELDRLQQDILRLKQENLSLSREAYRASKLLDETALLVLPPYHYCLDYHKLVCFCLVGFINLVWLRQLDVMSKESAQCLQYRRALRPMQFHYFQCKLARCSYSLHARPLPLNRHT